MTTLPSDRAVSPDPRPLLGEPLPIDLLNTYWKDSEGTHDLLENLDGLATWLASAGFADQVEVSRATLDALLTTRDALRSLVSGGPGVEDARSTLNTTLAHGSIRRMLGADGRTSRVEIVSNTWFPAWAAAEMYLQLLDEAPHRIRQCAGRGCILYFYDLSRNHTRYWCSVTNCGGRLYRRLAGLAADGASPEETFDVIAEEFGRLFQADYATVQRYEPDGMVTTVGRWSEDRRHQVTLAAQPQWPVDQDALNATILRTGRAARVTSPDEGTTGSWLHDDHIRCAVGCPVVIDGYTWGAMSAYYTEIDPPARVTESHMNEFAEEIALALAESRGRAELIDSRARLVSIGDETRRGIEHDLHDGVQQRLVSLGLEVADLARMTAPRNETLRKQLSHVVDSLSEIGDELRDIARGLHPLLSRHGLIPALRTLTRRAGVPTELRVGAYRRLPEPLEITIYYVVSEALTNVTKHARASSVSVSLDVDAETVRLSVCDDGVGGARLGAGSGLSGLRDRVESHGGRIRVTSPSGAGTSLCVELPATGTPGRRET